MTYTNSFYNELCQIIKSENLPSILDWMAFHSQSLILNHGEDNQLWECYWIVDEGKRFTSVEATPMLALKDVLNDVRTYILTERT